MLLLKEGIEMFSNMFWIKGKESVYFNIRERSVIQTYLKRDECNLVTKLLLLFFYSKEGLCPKEKINYTKINLNIPTQATQ